MSSDQRVVAAGSLGFPRIGLDRELKIALEHYWAGKAGAADVERTAAMLRERHWRLQAAAGLDFIPSNDFSLYDHVLDAAALVGAVPARFGFRGGTVDLDTYFAMARGRPDAPAMEMTKWFDTNYHFIVPELEPGLRLRVSSQKPVNEYREARAHGIATRPVLLGPVSFTLLAKASGGSADRIRVLDGVVEVYRTVLAVLAGAGARWIQLDEPCLGLDLSEAERALFRRAYQRLDSAPRLLVATYFADLRENLDVALRLPVAALHLDLVRAPQQLAPALARAPRELALSLGVVDGRGVWRTDPDRALRLVRTAVDALGPARVQIAPSCSLLHVPVDVDAESTLDPGIRSWLAFAKQKLEEVTLLARAATDDGEEVRARLAEQRRLVAMRRGDPRAMNPAVRARVAAVGPAMLVRHSAFAERRRVQGRRTPLPMLPTTTIGSLPQTAEVRRMRAGVHNGKISRANYNAFLRDEIARGIRFQESVGLDVLVHGEFERNDMVEYFAEQLQGFALTRKGWVQSYGSRCVKPPILHGDVFRPRPMSVKWARYAQSLTRRPVKGMLTGPVTMLQWSFVRDDLPAAHIAFQLALALRDEVADLEAAGLRVIQVDEPALREGLPLRESDRPAYVDWAVNAFRLATSVAADETQVHTHMCYAEFGEILEAVARMDADVVSIEAARSNMELLDGIAARRYPNDIGPGIYDIHSPCVPTVAELVTAIERALEACEMDRLWVNPDCGLKTRGWTEVERALANLVAAARLVREKLRHGARQGLVEVAGSA